MAAFGTIEQGWSKESWIDNLRRMADSCHESQADMAERYRRWADQLEATPPSKNVEVNKKEAKNGIGSKAVS